MMEDITLNIELKLAHAAVLLEILNRRTETLQRTENHEGPEALSVATQEKEAISAILMALDAAMKTHRGAAPRAMTPILQPLSQKTSRLPSVVAAEEEARRALAQAVESLAQAHAAFATSLASEGEIDASAVSAAIGVEETKLQRAQAAYDSAAGRALEAKAEGAETNRRAAYAQSQRAHDEALSALRQYEPLALEMLKLFSILTIHADLALADVEAADKARISPHAANAVRHLKTVLEEHKRGHTEAVTRHVLEALRQLELAAD